MPILVQVKSGIVHVSDIRDFGHVIDRENAPMGIFITLEKPTKPMKEEAIIKGFYKSNMLQRDFPKIQIITINELLHGKKLDLPNIEIPYKKARRFKPKARQLNVLNNAE